MYSIYALVITLDNIKDYQLEGEKVFFKYQNYRRVPVCIAFYMITEFFYLIFQFLFKCIQVNLVTCIFLHRNKMWQQIHFIKMLIINDRVCNDSCYLYLPHKQPAILGDSCLLCAPSGHLGNLGVTAWEGELYWGGHTNSPEKDRTEGRGFGWQCI